MGRAFAEPRRKSLLFHGSLNFRPFIVLKRSARLFKTAKLSSPVATRRRVSRTAPAGLITNRTLARIALLDSYSDSLGSIICFSVENLHSATDRSAGDSLQVKALRTVEPKFIRTTPRRRQPNKSFLCLDSSTQELSSASSLQDLKSRF